MDRLNHLNLVWLTILAMLPGSIFAARTIWRQRRPR